MWYSPKLCYFVFFAHKKYSRSFGKLRLNAWCHMDYFNDLFAVFLSLDGVRITVCGGPESSRISSKTSSFVFWRWTQVLRVWNDTRMSNYWHNFSFWWTIHLMPFKKNNKFNDKINKTKQYIFNSVLYEFIMFFFFFFFTYNFFTFIYMNMYNV